MIEIEEENIEIIERDFDVVDQEGDDRIGYEYYLKISNTPFFEKSEAEQLKQQIPQDQKLRESFEKYVKEVEDMNGNDRGVCYTPTLFKLQQLLKESRNES